MTAKVADDTLGPADSSAVKVFGTESAVEIYRRLLGVVGAGGYLSPGSPGAVLHGELERAGRQAQINTFGGGVNEVQREILAMAGTGHETGVTVSPPANTSRASVGGPGVLDERLQAFVGLSSGAVTRGQDAVNLPMIRHWVEAMGDHNPVYVDEAAARQAGFPGIIAPPTMLQVWIMRGLRASAGGRPGPGRRRGGW